MDTIFYSIFEGLNSAQKEAVENYEGPSLIIAGAGSGKTKVLTNRIANILNHGHDPGGVLALTFTNKASGEMKERIASIVGWKKARYIWMGTFHSIFLRFLKEDAGLLGYPPNFTVFDTSDSRSAIRACIKELNLDEKLYKPAEVFSKISMAKNNLYNASAYASNQHLINRDNLSRKPRIADIFALYEKKCKLAGAMDFDDILLNTNVLMRDFPDVLEKYKGRFSFILVDEYQDTNYAQYLIIKKLASSHRNICVVGDDAQSIYAFRGAKIENILNFRKDYPEAREFRLEQNYRSTKTIVSAANSLISKNSNQLKKECFSAAEQGDKIELVKAFTEQEEAFLIASSVSSKIHSEGCAYSEVAILYRTNAQSRAIEEALRKRSIPYKIYGGYSFFDREEVKDAMAYFRLVINPKDNEAFKRVIKVPSRGIGDTTLSRIQAASSANDISFWEALENGHLGAFGINSTIQQKIATFFEMITNFNKRVEQTNAFELAVEILVSSGYLPELRADNSLEGQSRVENIEELLNSIKSYSDEVIEQFCVENEADESEFDGVITLSEFMDNASLMSSVDESKNKKEESEFVSLMTVHSSKGLEFKHVYIAGMEENLFPSLNSIGSESEIEEERRLFYVAITRAKKSVSLSYSVSRMKWGNHVNNPPSRFIREIDQKFLNSPLERTNTSVRSSADRSIPGAASSIRSHFSSAQVPVKAPDPDFRADPISAIFAGQRIEHDRFGFGKIVDIEGEGSGAKAIVDFDEGGRKTLLLKFAKLRIVKDL